jgi:ATP-dependent Zn protease
MRIIIENIRNSNSILFYLFKTQKSLKRKDGNDVTFVSNGHCEKTYKNSGYKSQNSDDTDDDNTKDDEETDNFFISYGDYEYRFKDKHHMEISFTRALKSHGLQHDIDYFRELSIQCESTEIYNDFLKTANTRHNKKTNQTNIFTCDKYGDWSVYSKIPNRKLDTIYTDNKIKEQLKTDITNFIGNEQDYNKFGIPYKRTYLLTGIPGSGKTSIIKSICCEFGYHLSMLSICKEFDNNSLMYAFKHIPKKTILLIEDVDCMFEKRNGTRDNPLITFSSLLNILDGVLYKHGLIIVITTNHPERLDRSIMRMGRIDIIIEMNYPRKEELSCLFRDMMVGRIIDTSNITNQFNTFYTMICGKQITMSAIVNFLFRYREKWVDNITELLDNTSFIKKSTGDSSCDAMFI